MSLEQSISMEPVKEKLKNLPEHMPNKSQIVYDFGVYLADNLNLESIPDGFAIAAVMAIDDIKKGKNRITGKPFSGSLNSMPSEYYDILRITIQQITEVVCPEDFAKDVKDFYE